MKISPKKIAAQPEAGIWLAAFIITIIFYGFQFPLHKSSASPITGAESETQESDDVAPLPIPEYTILKGRTIKIPILMYHHVGSLPPHADSVRVGLTVSVEDFEAEVKWLHNEGYSSINLKDIYLLSQGKFNLPKKPVVFTFDDGYQDAFINAIPILKKYGYTGSFAIITDNPGTEQGTNIYEGWDGIKAAFNEKMEIVSHTQNHFDGKNPKFLPDYIFQNLSSSISSLQNNLGLTTNILIYPYGHYTADYITQAKKAGFVMGITVHEGDIINLDNLMEIPRVRVYANEDLERFKSMLDK